MDDSTTVVITGMGAVSPYGPGVQKLWEGLSQGANCMHAVSELTELPMVNTKVAATVPDTDYSFIPRKIRRSMSRMGIYAYLAAQEALQQAGYEQAPEHLGFFMGSTLNSISVWLELASYSQGAHLERIKTSDFLQIMNHSPLAAVCQALKINGPAMGGSEACATGLMNMGLGFLAIRSGLVSQALCGGTEEYHPMFSACFDIMQATSTNSNDNPSAACRPFDESRTGLVVSEGCGLVFMESKKSALARGVPILAEVLGFYSNTDTENMAFPSQTTLEACMRGALASTHISPKEVDLLNAHATGTIAGDIAETQAAQAVFGPSLKINSLKGHLGHTMGASGSLESIACVKMLADQQILPTKNLQQPDARCGSVDYVRSPRQTPLHIIMKNSFAIGGNNCSLLIRRPL